MMTQLETLSVVRRGSCMDRVCSRQHIWCPHTSREYTEILAVLFTHQHNPTSHKGCKGASDICVHMCTIKGEESSRLVKTAIYNWPDVPVILLDY